jgi:putative NADH-flavin reductase
MKILVIGGTGFAGSFIAKEAIKRGHEVVVLSRSEPQEKIEGVSYVQGNAQDQDLRKRLINNAEVVVATASPRGDMAGKLVQLYGDLANEAAEQQVRLVVIGGFTSLRPAAGQPRFYESGNIPKEYEAEITEMIGVIDRLQSDGPENLHWVFISPAAMFGSHLEITDHGKPRQSGDVALFDENGESKISGADFAIGVVDEIESNEHDKENI